MKIIAINNLGEIKEFETIKNYDNNFSNNYKRIYLFNPFYTNSITSLSKLLNLKSLSGDFIRQDFAIAYTEESSVKFTVKVDDSKEESFYTSFKASLFLGLDYGVDSCGVLLMKRKASDINSDIHIVSNFDENTSKFNYLLYHGKNKYNLSRIITMPIMSDIFSSFQYRKDDLFIGNVIKGDLANYHYLNSSKDCIDLIRDSMDLPYSFEQIKYSSLGVYTEDDQSGKDLVTIFFDFNKLDVGCRKSAKIVLLDSNLYVIVTMKPNIYENGQITTYNIVYDGDNIITTTIEDSYLDYGNDDIIDNTRLDPNHVIKARTFCYANVINTCSIVEDIGIVKDLDSGYATLSKLCIGDCRYEVYVSNNIANNNNGNLIVTENIDNVVLFDIFGNETTFKNIKDSMK